MRSMHEQRTCIRNDVFFLFKRSPSPEESSFHGGWCGAHFVWCYDFVDKELVWGICIHQSMKEGCCDRSFLRETRNDRITLSQLTQQNTVYLVDVVRPVLII